MPTGGETSGFAGTQHRQNRATSTIDNLGFSPDSVNNINGASVRCNFYVARHGVAVADGLAHGGEFPVTIFPDLSGAIRREKAFTLESLADAIFVKRPAKSACELLKLATFGNVPSDKGSLRHDGNVLSIMGVEADYDGGVITYREARKRLQAIGVECVLHTSPSHTPEKPRWRVLCPTSEPISPETRGRLLDLMNGVFDGALAPESWALSQAFFFGNCNGRDFRCDALHSVHIDACAFEGIEPIPGRPPRNGAGGGCDDKVLGWIAAIKDKREWHNALRDLVARKVAVGERDEEIHLIDAGVRWEGYTQEETAAEIQEFIDSARRKQWDTNTKARINGAASAARQGVADVEVDSGVAHATPVINAASVVTTHIEWYWRYRIAAKSITWLAGKGGTGKGLLAADIAAHVTNGTQWIDGAPGCTPGRVLWMEVGEDKPADTLVPRLAAAGANLEMVDIVRQQPPIDLLKGYRLMVASPGQTFLMAGKNANIDNDVRESLLPWTAAAEEYDCAILGLLHLSKNANSVTIDRVLGSVAWVNMARITHLLVADKANKTRALFGLGKSNISPPDLSAWWLRSTQVGETEQHRALTWARAEDGLEADDVVKTGVDDNKPRQSSAGEWLANFLADGAASTVIAAGEQEGYSESAIKKARWRNKRIVEFKAGAFPGKAWWRLLPS